MLTRSILLYFGLGERNRSASPRGGSFKCFSHVTPCKGKVKKRKRRKSSPKSVGYGKGKEGNGDGKYEASKIVIGSCAGRSSRGSYKEKSSNIGLSCLKIWNHWQILTLTILVLMMAGVVTNGLKVGAQLVGTKVGEVFTSIPQSHSLWEVLLLVRWAAQRGLGMWWWWIWTQVRERNHDSHCC